MCDITEGDQIVGRTSHFFYFQKVWHYRAGGLTWGANKCYIVYVVVVRTKLTFKQWFKLKAKQGYIYLKMKPRLWNDSIHILRRSTPGNIGVNIKRFWISPRGYKNFRVVIKNFSSILPKVNTQMLKLNHAQKRLDADEWTAVVNRQKFQRNFRQCVPNQAPIVHSVIFFSGQSQNFEGHQTTEWREALAKTFHINMQVA